MINYIQLRVLFAKRKCIGSFLLIDFRWDVSTSSQIWFIFILRFKSIFIAIFRPKALRKKVLCFVLTLKITVTNWNKSHGKFSDFSYQLFIIMKSSLNLFLKVITYTDFSVGYKSPLTYFLNYSPTIQLKSSNERELKRIITVSAVICLNLVYIYDV